jgi:low affinity Fe/Cu permease
MKEQDMISSSHRLMHAKERMQQEPETRKERIEEKFERLAVRTAKMIGSAWTFGIALIIVLMWAFSGPLFHFSDTWQLVINTGTTIATFLTVFLLQQTQNKDGLAIQLKLDVLIAAVEGANNRMISLEDLTNKELEELKLRFVELAEAAHKRHHEADSIQLDQGRARPR